MERETKFRGKCVKTEKWVYGCLLIIDNKTFIVPQNTKLVSFLNRKEINCLIEVIPETVGQFTELTDKNGVEIYEGDILINPYNTDKNVVKYGMFCEDENYPKSKSIGFYLDNETGLGFDINGDMSYEITYNIHENPELLNN